MDIEIKKDLASNWFKLLQNAICDDISRLEKNRVNLIYTIDPGDKAKIAKIFFLGDKKLRTNRLRGVITSQEAKFWKVN